MPAVSRRLLFFAAFVASLNGTASAAALQRAAPLARVAADDTRAVALPGDLPGALATSRDEGALAGGTLLQHMRLALTRPAASQAALDQLTHDQLVRGMADYHRWLTPGQLRSYGPAQTDIDKVLAWLRSRGLRVDSVSPSGMSIEFDGRAADVAAAFRTQLHNVLHDGEAHIANITAPAIPAALARVVTGVTLSNFFPKPALRRFTPSLTVGSQYGTFYAVAPADFATIYNVNPLRGSHNFYGGPITGAGVTLAVVEETRILAPDWRRFRKVFGLSGYSGTLTNTHPGHCAYPGYTGDEGEAALDAEWSSAIAPDANIIEASCAGGGQFGFGVLTSLQNLVEYGTPATILSISYEGPETEFGFAFEATWNNLLEEGAAEGKAIFVAAGDNGVSADRNQIDADGLFVNGLADSAYNVSVGGTDFYDTALGENSKYWRSTNGRAGRSAISYVPEIPWNNSCASSVIWNFEKAGGAIPLCNSSFDGVQNGVGGSGSQSVYYTKPYWQSTAVLGVPNDGVRDQPDVSLFAGNGIWNHFYVFCMSDVNEGGAPCDYGTFDEVIGNAAGGTSFGAPAFAGIAALLQQTHEPNGAVFPLGNPAPALYQIAQAQFSTPLGLRECNSSLGKKISTACVFNYVTAGDISEPCYKGTAACHTTAQSTEGIGVLEAHVGGRRVVAYPAQRGYSLATGLGTVNVTNLLYNYSP